MRGAKRSCSAKGCPSRRESTKSGLTRTSIVLEPMLVSSGTETGSDARILIGPNAVVTVSSRGAQCRPRAFAKVWLMMLVVEAVSKQAMTDLSQTVTAVVGKPASANAVVLLEGVCGGGGGQWLGCHVSARDVAAIIFLTVAGHWQTSGQALSQAPAMA